LDAGVNAFVAQPINELELKAKIVEALGRLSRKEDSPGAIKAPPENVNRSVKLKVAHIPIIDAINFSWYGLGARTEIFSQRECL
jgi:hypothetical protein